MKALSPEPSHSEKSAVKANLEPIISVICRQTCLPAGFFVFFLRLEQRLIVGSHGNSEHGGDG